MLDQRDFLKLGGATAFAVLFGGCDSIPRKIVPFVIPPEDYTLGESLWYASGCRQCPAGCGIVVRVSEGRAKKIEGNPLHPVNRGKLCARGQAALQALYHPERLAQPLALDGPRGSGRHRKISWQEALSLLMGGLKKAKERPASLLMLTEPMRGHEGLVAGRFLQAFGSPNRFAWDPFGQDAFFDGCAAAYGARQLPELDIANTRYLLSFSGDFLETWISPVHYARAYGAMRQDRPTVRGKLVHFGARLSMTAAAADLYLPAAPGTEGLVALGIAHVLVREKLTHQAAQAPASWKKGLEKYSPGAVAAKSGVSADTLAAVAREFASNQPGLAVAGTGAGSCTNGKFQHFAVGILNVLAGNLGKEGGVLFPDRAAEFSRYGKDARLLAPEPGSGYPEVRAAMERMRKGEFRMALLAGASNPAFTIPHALKFSEALLSVPFVVSFASFLDETSSLSDLILPAPTFLEAWGDDIAPAGHEGEAVTLLQPVVDPFRDTRSMPDVLIAAARELGGETARALPWGSFKECLEKAYGGPGGPMEKYLQEGGIFRGRKSSVGRLPRAPAKGNLPEPEEATFDGDPARYPLVLHLYPSIAHYDGRGANLSWLQELPDPVTTAVWRNWVEIHPETAQKLGLSDGDGVIVSSPAGKIEAHVAFHPGIAQGVAAMPLGQGHGKYGKNAEGRGGNPFKLLPAATQAGCAGFPLQSTRIALEKTSLKTRLVRTAHPEGQWKIGNVM